MSAYDQLLQLETNKTLQDLLTAIDTSNAILNDVVFELRDIKKELRDMAKSTKSAPPTLKSDGNKVFTPTNADRKGGKQPKGGK